jgi:hypothetical protein
MLARTIWPSSATPEPILTPGFKARYTTSEFDFVASVNSFGFRGNEVDIEHGQVAMIGDSFVYGWGVNSDNTLPHYVRDYLRESGMPLEVYNLGKPGGDPEHYLEIARSFIPWMRPKFVVLSILQGDDPAQILERRQRRKAGRGRRNQWVAWTRNFATDNLRGLISAVRSARRMSQGPMVVATEEWKETGARLLSEGDLRLPSDIQEMLLSGDLNPALVWLAAKYPRRMVLPYQRRHSNRIRARLTRIVREIGELTVESGGRVVLVSLPLGIYYESTIRNNYSRMGFDLPATDACPVDGLIEDVGRELGIPFVIPGAEFQGREDADSLWFAYDGHLTPSGNQVVARVIARALVQLNEVGSISSQRSCVNR